jgi:ABC-type sugar transport system ATPase subunit
MSDFFLETKGLSKSFPGTQALDGVAFTVRRGEVHGLIGENGAGKSTLVNIVSGVYPPTAGEILIDGTRVELKDPLEARRQGIVTIHQELSLFLNRDVAYNIFAGNERRSGRIFLDRAAMAQGADTLLRSLGLAIDPRTPVSRLTIAQAQLVEIARALSTNARLIFMDEPTSSLSAAEIDMLGGIIARLKADGVSIVFVTHKLNEIIRFTDTTTILRDGKVVDTLVRADYTNERFIQGMVGRRISEFFPRQEKSIGEVCLDVRNLSTAFLKDISFTVRKGEVLGLAGPVGSGRTEIMKAIFGIDRIASGEIRIFGQPVHIRNPREAVRHGMALVPEDRKLEGVVLELPVKSNVVLSILRRISRLGFLRIRERDRIVGDSMRSFSIKAHSTAQLVKSLSGGNQQKVVISKWLAAEPTILFLDEPTRGIDIGAKQEIYAIINSLAQKGFSLILASSELEEVIRMSDRILVLYEGRIKETLASATATEEAVLTAVHR